MVIFFTHSSSMLLLLMSVDRAIAISFLLRRNNQILTHLAKKSGAGGGAFGRKQHTNITRIVIGLFLLISILNAHFLFFVHIIKLGPIIAPTPVSDGHNGYNITKAVLNNLTTDSNEYEVESN